MSWLTVALIGYVLAAVVALFDKFLLVKKLNPWQYVIYGGLFGISALLLIPFGFSFPSAYASMLAALSGVFFLAALYPLYLLINRTEITRANPLVGALVPVFTVLAAYLVLHEQLERLELLAFGLLVIGGFLIIIRRTLLRHSLVNAALATLSAALFALSYVTIKASYLAGASFITGYVIARISAFIVVLILITLLWPRMKKMFAPGPPTRIQITWVGANKILSGISSLVLNYAVFLGSVTLVQALQGVQYVFILFFGALAGLVIPALKERFTLRITLVKLAAVLIIGAGLVLLSLHERPRNNPGEILIYGVTFSTLYTEELELDYQDVLTALLDDMGARHFRVVAYWPEIEPQQDEYDFTKLDWIINEIEARNGQIILAMGRKVPRHPECHIPPWVQEPNGELGKEELHELLAQVVERYKERGVIYAWQVENEPFLPTTSNLGSCPPFDVALLDSEIALVRSLDGRPVVVTDSGEIGDWLRAYRRADIFGTSLYRVVHTGLGYFHHISPPDFYFVKANLARLFFGDKRVMVIELQAEPWGPEQTYDLDVTERRRSMSLDQLKENISFAQRVGYAEVYLWGAEWWYWEKEEGYPEFWDHMSNVFHNERKD